MMIKKIINSLQFSLENVTVKLCFLTVYIHSLYWWIPPYLYLKHLLILILPLSQYGPFAKSPTNKIHFWTCLLWPKLFASINNLVSPLILFIKYTNFLLKLVYCPAPYSSSDTDSCVSDTSFLSSFAPFLLPSVLLHEFMNRQEVSEYSNVANTTVLHVYSAVNFDETAPGKDCSTQFYCYCSAQTKAIWSVLWLINK